MIHTKTWTKKTREQSILFFSLHPDVNLNGAILRELHRLIGSTDDDDDEHRFFSTLAFLVITGYRATRLPHFHPRQTIMERVIFHRHRISPFTVSSPFLSLSLTLSLSPPLFFS